MLVSKSIIPVEIKGGGSLNNNNIVAMRGVEASSKVVSNRSF